ncbi:ABC transporter permease [uncultured Roseobacter sp.]|uniref:ABC transporter permease n=1 Tax=uncultured Roseobacter sp. TaxID=114847 RepID=UPI002636798B|nr:ABC transporter permease [uncultured Roseobacter sp.]
MITADHFAKPDRWREYRRMWVTFRLSQSAILGLCIVSGLLTLAAIGLWILPFPKDTYGAVHFERKLQPPNATHWSGTDEVALDIYTRVIIGDRTTLWIGLTVTGIAVLIGAPLGLLAGMSDSWLCEVIMRVTDVFLSIPGLILPIAIVGALGPGIMNAMFALALVWWQGYARLVQAKVLSVRNETCVEAARSIGASQTRIVFSCTSCQTAPRRSS